MPHSPRVTVTKLEAAQRQIDAAIELWFSEGDSVAIHTLACAGHQVIHDINEKHQGRDLLFNSLNIKDEHRTKYINHLKKPMNFFKHADKQPDTEATVELNTDMTVLFIIFSILGLYLIEASSSSRRDAFLLWLGIHRPEWLTPAGQYLFTNALHIEEMDCVRNIQKREFLHEFLTITSGTVA